MNIISEIVRTVLSVTFKLDGMRTAIGRIILNRPLRICALLCAAIATTGSKRARFVPPDGCKRAGENLFLPSDVQTSHHHPRRRSRNGYVLWKFEC